MKPFAGFCAFFILLVLSISSSLAVEFTPVVNEKACLSEGTVIYSEIGLESDDELESGTIVEVLDVDGAWARVSYINTEFYVPVSILTATAEQFEQSVSVSSTGRVFYLSKDCAFICDQSRLEIDFEAGESVVMLDASGTTARVLLGGMSGRVPLDALALTEDLTYALGLPGDSIKPLQKRLEQLGYFDGVPNGILDIDTVDAVLRFRYVHSMSDEFNVEGEFRDVVYSDSAEHDPIRILSLNLSDASQAVLRLQKRLIAKGYLIDTPTGFYDALTGQAVSLFQSMNGLEQTGLANTPTMRALFSSEARKLPRNLMPVTPETSVYMPGSVVLADWWESDIQQIFAIDSVATITDVDTGLTWREKRRGGYNHADVEPLTSQDTEIMLLAVQGEWTWERRAIWVSINGVRYAASMNCMPHGGGEITDNGFDGHHCVHFLNSRTHASNRLDERHQACVAKAAGISIDQQPVSTQQD